MKIIPAIIAIGFGGCFLAAELRFNYYPPVAVVSMSSFESAEEKHARASVLALLFYPESASIDGMHTVKPDGALYVCGSVNSKDRSGSYAGSRGFVYEVAHDFAIIDNDETIARSHRTFRPCPDEDAKPKPFVVDVEQLSKIAQALPKSNIQIVTSLSPTSSSASTDGPRGNQDLRQGIEALRPNIQQNTPQQSAVDGASTQSRPAIVSPPGESEWRSEQPPKSWPRFPPDDPLSKPEAAFANDEALELASDTERRWKRFESRKTTSRPSVTEIDEALRALMTIREQDPHYARAWASFVRLRKIRRDTIALSQ